LKSCTILFSGDKIIISSAVDTPGGEIKWGKPLIILKRDAGAIDIGNAIIDNLKSPIESVAQPKDILKETGFSSWEDFSRENMMMTAELKGEKIIIHPYFSGLDGEYYAVLNRDKESGLEPYELGHDVLRSLEYCI
jgi:hypothetical protein